MNELKERLIRKAIGIHEKIYPCKGKYHLDDCFTIDGQKIIFWFNTEDQSTHVLFEKIIESERN